MACYKRDEFDNPVVESSRRPHLDEWEDLVFDMNWYELDREIARRKRFKKSFTKQTYV